jgi:hypothetical protein
MGLLKALTENFTEKVLKCTDDAELVTRSIIKTELEHGADDGCSYVWNSTNSDIDIGDTRLFVKNTSNKALSLEKIIFNPSNVVCRWSVSIGALTTTPTGTIVTVVNMNEIFTSDTFDYVAFDDETAVATGTEMFAVTTSTTQSLTEYVRGVTLGKNHYIQITQLTESTSGQVSLFGHISNS